MEAHSSRRQYQTACRTGSRAALQAEIVALRHQIAVLQQSAPRRLRLRQSDRLLWIWLSRFWPGWRRWLRILKPDTVLRWHRSAFAVIGPVNRAAVREDQASLLRFAI
jgi:hypothetical protein